MTNRVVFLFAIALLSMAPMLFLQGLHLWEKAHMQFFPLAIGAYIWFLTDCRVGAPPARISTFAFRIAIFATSLFLLAAFLYSPWIAQVTATLLALSFSLLKYGEEKSTRLYALSSLLWITVPLPGSMDTRFIHFLQSASSSATSHLLDALQIPHLQELNIIQIPEKRLFVEEACSGVDSLYALTAVAITIALLKRRSLVHSVIPVATAPLWAALSNLLRLFAIVIGLHYFHIDLSHGTSHTILGLLVFGVSVLCHIFTDRFVSAWFHPIVDNPLRQDGESSIPNNRVIGFVNRVWAYPNSAIESVTSNSEGHRLPTTTFSAILIPTFMMGLITLWVLIAQRDQIHDSYQLSNEMIGLLPDKVLMDSNPDTGGKLVRYEEITRERNDAFGEFSRAWSVSYPEREATCSLDFPFRGWHGLYTCYVLTGWEIEALEAFETQKRKSDQRWPWVRGRFVKPDGRRAYVWYTYFDLKGNPIEPSDPNEVGKNSFWEFIVRTQQTNLFAMAIGKHENATPIAFQYQLMLETPLPLSLQEEDLFTDRFQKTRLLVLEGCRPALTRRDSKD